MIKHLIIVGLFSFVSSIAIGQENLLQTEPAIPSGPLTKIEFQESVFEFGELKEGEKIKNVFVFTNTGTEPLVISQAKGSCGCTVPMFPKEPIMPGESADLLVEFDSKGKGKVDGSLQSKRVTITANTDPANTYLTIKGKVFKDEDTESNISKKKASIEKNLKGIQLAKNPDVDPSKVSLYPNPTYDQLNLDLQAFTGQQGIVEIYDGAGSKVAFKQVDNFGEVMLFDVGDYTPGVYTVSIKIDGMNRIAKRFVVPAGE